MSGSWSRSLLVAFGLAVASVPAAAQQPAAPTPPAAPVSSGADVQQVRDELDSPQARVRCASAAGRSAAARARTASLADWRRAAGRGFGDSRHPRARTRGDCRLGADAHQRRRDAAGAGPAPAARPAAYGHASRVVEGLQSRHVGDRQLRRRRRARIRTATQPSLQLSEVEVAFQAIVDPYATRGLLSVGGTRGPRSRRGLRHVHHAARRPAAEGRQDARAVRQGEHAAHARDADGRSAARDARTSSAAKRACRTRACRCRT